MFGHKKIVTSSGGTTPSGAVFIVMPDIFYGGRDPELYRPPAADRTGAPPAPSGNAARRAPQLPRLNMLSGRSMIIAGCVFLVAVGGIAWYYIRQARPAGLAAVPPTALPSASVRSTPEPTTDAPSASSTAISASPEAASTTPTAPLPKSLRPPTLTFPAFGLPASADLDADSLTDAEEQVFHTDSGKWDTDGDGYYDGQEAVNLYNPGGIAPMKLIDSGLVQDYVNPQWQYRVYYPGDWQIGTVDPGANEVLMSAADGDFVVVRASPKAENETFPAWFARVTPSESFSDLLQSVNRFGVPVWMRRDREAAYIPGSTAVYVLQYGARDNQRELKYPHVLEMMIQSFRLSTTAETIPEQRPLPPSSP